MTKDSPIIWGLGGGLLAGAVLLLAYLSLPLLATVTAVGLATAAGMASVRSQQRKPGGQSETWENEAARIAVCAEGLDQSQDKCSSKFQAMLLNQEQSSNCRMH